MINSFVSLSDSMPRYAEKRVEKSGAVPPVDPAATPTLDPPLLPSSIVAQKQQQQQEKRRESRESRATRF